MNKYLKVLILCLIFYINTIQVISASDKQSTYFDWRKKEIYLGMAKKDLKLKIGNLSKDNYWIFNAEYLALPCSIYFDYYSNVSESLVLIEYYFTEKYSDYMQYIGSYKRANIKLVNEYGACTVEKQVWKDEKYKKNKEKWGTALIEDQLVFYSLWKQKDKVIVHTLGTYEGQTDIEHKVEFFDPVYYKNTFEKDYNKILEKQRKNMNEISKARIERRLADIRRRIKEDTFYSVGDDPYYKIKWGISRAETKMNDGFGFLGEDNEAIYAHTTLFGYPVDVTFMLKTDPQDTAEGLCDVSYEFIDRFKKPEEHMADFRKINSIMTEKYGKPYSKEIMLKAFPLSFEPDNYLSAFEAGDLRYSWHWSTRKISIIHYIWWIDEIGAIHTISIMR